MCAVQAVFPARPRRKATRLREKSEYVQKDKAEA